MDWVIRSRCQDFGAISLSVLRDRSHESPCLRRAVTSLPNFDARKQLDGRCFMGGWNIFHWIRERRVLIASS